MDLQDILNYSKDLNILYAEDDAQLLQETSEALEDFFATTQTASNGQIALQKYKKYKEGKKGGGGGGLHEHRETLNLFMRSIVKTAVFAVIALFREKGFLND